MKPARVALGVVQAGILCAAFFTACVGGRQEPAPPQPPPREPAPIAPTPAPEPPVQALLPPSPAPVLDDVTRGNPPVTVRLFHGTTAVALSATSELQLGHGQMTSPVASGAWQCALAGAKPARQRFHVFSKTFKPSEEGPMQQYIAEWTAKGYAAEGVLRGDRFRTNQGVQLDGRQYWISLARAGTQPEAERIVKRLEALSTWAWVRAETVAHGSGSLTLRASSGQSIGPFQLPITIRCESPVTVQAGKAGGTYSGSIELRVEPDNTLGVYETLPLEDYLAGVLPAEMPAQWPLDALKAQAVSARSDVLMHMGLKRSLEGFHYTNSEGDRVYAGFGGRQPNTDAAVAQTRGQVLTANGRIVAAVFSSNCGGWTESNENVWSSPVDPVLRGVSDLAASTLDPSRDIAGWLAQRPPAYCAADEKAFRWTRRFTAAQLTGLVNKRHPVGAVQRIEAGERGVSGRLKSVKVTGARGMVVIRKELPIRQAFGDLPSAMLIIKEERGPSGPIAWIFHGGGRGHGVGLCQHGARGMALKGFTHDAILQHYFSGSALMSVE